MIVDIQKLVVLASSISLIGSSHPLKRFVVPLFQANESVYLKKCVTRSLNLSLGKC